MICINNDTEIELIKIINDWDNFYKYRTLDEKMLIIANEINSVNNFNGTYKLLPITTKAYIDTHYSYNNKYYDIFKLKSQDMDYENMHQVILCDNYAEVLRFPQDNYEKRKYVSRFSLLDPKIYSFFDGSIIVVETKDGRSEEPYKYL